jgi:uncharacterized protein
MADSDEETGPDQLLRHLHQAQSEFYAGGDASALEAVLHPDVVWHVPGRNTIAGDHRGIAEVMAYMTRRRELSERSFRMQTRELLIGPTHFASLTDGSAVISGVRHEWSTIGLYRRHQGQIIECWLIPFDQPAFDRAWTVDS